MGAKEHYDRGVNTFSPEGRIYQIEYALEAINHGSTSIGIKTKEGVVLGVEKKLASRSRLVIWQFSLFSYDLSPHSLDRSQSSIIFELTRRVVENNN